MAPVAASLRTASANPLHAALVRSREALLAMFAGFEAALGLRGLHVAFDPVLNLPLWELGHIGWFEEWWILRNPDRARGLQFDAARRADQRSLLPQADACYDSASVPHASRWRLELPDADRTRDYLERVRGNTLALLRTAGDGDDALYFFRLVLFHEMMHREAWFMMAQQLGIDLNVGLPRPHVPGAAGERRVPGGMQRIGADERGFAFDNELHAHEQQVPPYAIDRTVVTWRRYLPMLEAGGYEDERLWSTEGWQWRLRHGARMPRHWRRTADGRWAQCRFGHWQPLDLDAPATHLSAHEASAWCRWAGRRLPTEAEWETAAQLAAAQRERFSWGQVWEWTTSPFAPYPGFVPHAYREYSAPFFDGRPVLRGGSFATDRQLLDARYRNYFAAERTDVFAGFRSCAID